MHAIGETPSLQELDEQYGDFDPAALWSEIKIRVPPELKVRFEEWLADGEGTTKVEKLANLLG